MHKPVVVTSLTQLVKVFGYQNDQILFSPQFAYPTYPLRKPWSLATRCLFRVLHVIISIKQYRRALCQAVDNHGIGY